MARNVSKANGSAEEKLVRAKKKAREQPQPPQWPEPVFPSSLTEEDLARFLARANMCEHANLVSGTRFVRWTWRGRLLAETDPGRGGITFYENDNVRHTTPAVATKDLIARAQEIRWTLAMLHRSALRRHEVTLVQLTHGPNPYR